RFFGTPHSVDLEALCAAHGIKHERLTSEQQLIHVLGDPTEGRRVLEGVSDRSQRPAVHAAVQAAVRATFVSSTCVYVVFRSATAISLQPLDLTSRVADHVDAA